MRTERVENDNSEKGKPSAIEMARRLKEYGKTVLNPPPENSFFQILSNANIKAQEGNTQNLEELYEAYKDRIEVRREGKPRGRRMESSTARIEKDSNRPPDFSRPHAREVTRPQPSKAERADTQTGPATSRNSNEDVFDQMMGGALTAAAKKAASQPIIIGERKPGKPSSLERFALPSEQVRRAARYIRNLDFDGFQAMYWEWTHKKHPLIRPADILDAENEEIKLACIDAFKQCIANGDVKRFKELASFLKGSWTKKLFKGSEVKLMDRNDWLQDVQNEAAELLRAAIDSFDGGLYFRTRHAVRVLRLISSEQLRAFAESWNREETRQSQRTQVRYQKDARKLRAAPKRVDYVEAATSSMEKYGLPTQQVSDAAYALKYAKFKPLLVRIFSKDKHLNEFENLLTEWEIRDKNLTKENILYAKGNKVYDACVNVLKSGLDNLRNPKKDFSRRMRYLNSSKVDYLGRALFEDEDTLPALRAHLERRLKYAMDAGHHHDYLMKKINPYYHMGVYLEVKTMMKDLVNKAEQKILKFADKHIYAGKDKTQWPCSRMLFEENFKITYEVRGRAMRCI